jgi:nucleotide-binding universal stress UspA family protein
MTIDGQRIIIKGSHSHRGVERGFFGVREAALRNALGPVLVVRRQN